MTLGKTRRKSGFSLMEFLIVIGIIAVLAVIIVPATVGIINKSNEQNDKVLAATYTEYMQKFATEKAGSADFYSTIYNDGVGSEYDILESNSGLGSFPGITQLNEKINSSNEEDVWKSIRKEACIAIKAYGEIELADNDKYFIEKPLDESMAFVYYYLTGNVEIKKVSDMKKITVQEVNDGAIDTEDYWVFLDREGGSGKAVGTSTQKDFYVQIYQYGVENSGLYNEPINGAKVSINYKDKTGKDCTKSAITTTQGLLVFRDVPSSIIITAEREGAISYPDSTYYPVSETGPWYAESRLPNAEYWRSNVINTDTVGVGNSASNPFIIYLKMGTLGSLEFLETVKTYQYTPGSGLTYKTDKVQIINPNDFTTSFEKTSDSIRGRDEVYESSTPGYNPLELLGVDGSGIFRFLMYGDYNMNITNTTINTAISGNSNSNFLPYNETITSDIFGIYNKENPGDYPLNSAPYSYPVTLKRTDTLIKGTLVAENSGQPLHGTYLGFLAPSTDNKASDSNISVTVTTKVYAVNSKNDYYCSNALTSSTKDANGCYVYDYEVYLTGQNNGSKEYEVFLVTEYGRKDGTIIDRTISKLDLAQWPDKVVADGSTYVFKTTTSEFTQVILQSDVATANPKVIAYEKNNSYNGNKKFLGFVATLTRKGYENNKTNGLTYYTSTSNSENGIATFSNVKKGFYTLYIDYKNQQTDRTYDVFIDDDNTYIIEEATGGPLVKYSFKFIPKTSDNKTLTGQRGILDEKKYNGTTDAGITFDIYLDGQKFNGKQTVDRDYGANGEVTLVFYDTGISSSISINPIVNCFNKDSADKLVLTNLLINENYSGTDAIIHRIDNDVKLTDDYHPEGFWKWTANDTEHWQVCQRCVLERFRTDHHYRLTKNDTPGTDGTAVTPDYYAEEAAVNGDNKNTANGHYAHCKVCNLKDTYSASCSGGSWTYYHSLYTGTTKGHTGHTSTGYALSYNASSGKTGVDSYHYKYCDKCHQRYDSEKHKDNKDYSYKSQTATCVRDGFEEWDCVCEYYRKDTFTGGHNYIADGEYYKFNWMNFCYLTYSHKVCTNCGDRQISAGTNLSHNEYKEHKKLGTDGKIFTSGNSLNSGKQVAKLYALAPEGSASGVSSVPGESGYINRWVVPDKCRIAFEDYDRISSGKGDLHQEAFGNIYSASHKACSTTSNDTTQQDSNKWREVAGAGVCYSRMNNDMNRCHIYQCNASFTLSYVPGVTFYCDGIYDMHSPGPNRSCTLE